MPAQHTKVLITGASGFLGGNILSACQQHARLLPIAACRDKSRLSETFTGEVRVGDLRDTDYVNSLVKDIDIICHAGTWAAMWNHRQQEQQNFYQPTINLIDAAMAAGVKRFIMSGSVVMTKPSHAGVINDDVAAAAYTKFWPHLDYLIDIDRYMQDNAQRGMQMIQLRLGHFVGAGNALGLVPVLVPRLKTCLVPWLAGGKSRMPLLADSDAGNGFIAACLAANLNNYESFNICGMNFPRSRDVIAYIADKTGSAKPWFSVPYTLGYAFAWLMEKLYPLLPGKAPFLTRSIVHLAEDWHCATQYAQNKLGYQPQKSWQDALDEALAQLQIRNYPWPALAQRG